MHCDFLGSDGLQETNMDVLKPFNSKLTMRVSFFTKLAALAHGAARLFVWSYRRLSTFRNADSSMSRTKVYSFSTYILEKRLFWSRFGEILHSYTF